MKNIGKAVIAVVALIGITLIMIQFNGAEPSRHPSVTSKIFVGGDIHTLTVTHSEFIVTGHESAAISTDGGSRWRALKTLDGADVMGWSAGRQAIFAGGHLGLFKSQSTDNDFVRIEFHDRLTDVHALGAAGPFVYLASPGIGFLASADDGKSWVLRNSKIGQGFMGSMLVDSQDPQKILVADMQQGLLSTSNGGRSWISLGGPVSPMAIAWNPSDHSEIVVIGMAGAGMSADGGSTWSDIAVPSGAAAISFSENGKEIYVASLQAPFAHIFISSDRGENWSPLRATSDSLNSRVDAGQLTSEMDPDMPGMDHSDSSDQHSQAPVQHSEEPERPLATALGIFGLASSFVVSSAWIMRRKDRAAREEKLAQRKARGDQR